MLYFIYNYDILTCIIFVEGYMGSRQDLEIFIITYNRREKLKKTFEQIFDIASPVREFDIKVIDNASNDGTRELCMEYAERFSNLVYISNNRNIGLSGNIIKPFELASKKWLWVLCDDDDFDWTHWAEIEKALNNDENAIIMAERLTDYKKLTLPVLINEFSFLPAAIYNTKNITTSVMQKMYINAYTLFPHLALVCEVVNQGKKIFVPENIIVKQSFTLEKDNKQYARGTNQDLHFRQRRFHLFCGFANSFRMINDRKLRYACCENFMLGYPFNKAMSLFLNHNGLDINNIFDLFCAFSIKQNLIFLLLIMLHILQNILRIDISSERIYIVILKKIKIRINLIRRYKNA